MAAVGLAALLPLAWAQPAQATFPGANGKIVFVAQTAPSTNDYKLFSIDPDGSDETQLTLNTRGDDTPAWSPDGLRIAFRRDLPNDVISGYIHVMSADGSGVTQLTSDIPGAGPAWSGDGTRIAFNAHLDSGSQIYLMNADGSAPGPFPLAHGLGPAWSPDSEEILYISNAHAFGFTNEIWSHRVTDEPVDPVRLTNNTYEDAGPNWSPDDSKIAFTTNRDGNYEIYVMNRDGSDQTRITDHPASDYHPVWSPDGTKIAFVSNRDGFSQEIYVMNVDGSGQTRISNDSLPDFQPDWQPTQNQPPECTAVAAGPRSLWPTTRGFRTVLLTGATDPNGDLISISIDGVTQDEPVGANPDARVLGDGSVRLRAERDPHGDGRVYQVAFTVSDESGANCSATAAVEVRLRKHRPAVDSSPPSYDSLGP